jgi:hypothetical protein
LCTHCGKNYNIADIYLPASNGQPEIRMPPLPPAPDCVPFLEQRADDTEQVVRNRLQVRWRLLNTYMFVPIYFLLCACAQFMAARAAVATAEYVFEPIYFLLCACAQAYGTVLP